jgi:hypothetical protein
LDSRIAIYQRPSEHLKFLSVNALDSAEKIADSLYRCEAIFDSLLQGAGSVVRHPFEIELFVRIELLIHHPKCGPGQAEPDNRNQPYSRVLDGEGQA